MVENKLNPEEEKKSDSANEPEPSYNNRLTITTLAGMEERDRESTRKMTHEQRMEYLNKLIRITHGEDLSEQVKAFYNGKIRINKNE